uniref:Reverse transcriptase zinc-binding domain-containing protein n=1 Tax=Triticum urartu TaxID=4572 RepID=A0A8R7PRW5_TRIUA
MNNCWTSDWLARRGLPHQDACPFCDQHEETISHMLIECVLAREVWAKVFTAMGVPHGAPHVGEPLPDWCARQDTHGRPARTMRTLCLLVMWELWKHRNAIVFDGATVSLQQIMHRIASESKVWRQAELLRGELDAFFVEALEWARRE